MNLHCFKIHRCYSIPFNLSNVDEIFWGWIRKTVSRFRKRKRKFCDVFTYSLKRAREIREFHVAIVQRWLTNVQKRARFKGLARRLTFFPANTSAPMKQICERPLVSVIDFSFPEQCFFPPTALTFQFPASKTSNEEQIRWIPWLPSQNPARKTLFFVLLRLRFWF